MCLKISWGRAPRLPLHTLVPLFVIIDYSHTFDPGTRLASRADSKRAGPRAVCPFSSRLYENKLGTSTSCHWLYHVSISMCTVWTMFTWISFCWAPPWFAWWAMEVTTPHQLRPGHCSLWACLLLQPPPVLELCHCQQQSPEWVLAVWITS